MDHAQKMREALAVAGAGTQGDYTYKFYLDWTRSIYSECWCTTSDWESREGRTSPRSKSRGYFARNNRKQVIDAMQSVHPYEEPAYDLFAIDEPVEKFGLGRIGELPQEIPLETFVEQVKKFSN